MWCCVLVCSEAPENHGNRSNAKTLGDSMGFHGIPWDSMGFHGIPPNSMRCGGAGGSRFGLTGKDFVILAADGQATDAKCCKECFKERFKDSTVQHSATLQCLR